VAEISGSGAGLQIRPEQVKNIVAVQGVVASQGKQLQQALRLAQMPVGVRHGAFVHNDLKPAEESNS
jgi:hypothetical protein